MPSLAGKRVVITRSPAQMDEFAHQLIQRGAVPVPIHLSQTRPPKDWHEVDAAVDALSSFDLIVFSSRNAVRFFCERVRARGKEEEFQANIKAAVGQPTADELKAAGFSVQILPHAAHAAEELVQAILSSMSVKGKSVLFPRALEGRSVLIDQLEAEGASVQLLPVYRTVLSWEDSEKIQSLIEGRENVDWLTFAASSAVEFFGRIAGNRAFPAWVKEKGIHIAAMGRVTAKTLQEWGLDATVVAEEPSGEGMIEAMEAFERMTHHGT